MATPAIETVDLVRTYKARKKRGGDAAKPGVLTALAGVSLEVRPGELFGLLGPNGAGKTTLIKILTTLLSPTSGVARVDGLDVVTRAGTIRERINMVSGGESSGYGLLTVRENLWLFSQLYGVPTGEAKRRIDAMLEVVGLGERADTKISQLSTGMRQKMNFCRGFITDPKVLFLDEPTLGLDVTAARSIRAFVRGWVGERPGRTLLLTTHYLHEADELCDRLAIIDHGRVLACETPAGLKRRAQQHRVFEITLAAGRDGWDDVGRLPGVQRATVTPLAAGTALTLELVEEAVIGAVVQHLAGRGGHILTLRQREPSLEDVFLSLVGRPLDAEEGDAP
jgi:ABC-2 type transport system ATP-binding protein